MTVGVVGLGFAGLRAAALLEEAGHTVLGFEARDRVGGRCETVFDAEGHAIFEAGGEWIDGDHDRTIDLLAEFGLTPTTPEHRTRRLVYQGEVTTDDALWPDALHDAKRTEIAIRDALAIARETGTVDVNASVNDLIWHGAKTPRGRWWQVAQWRSDEGEELDRVGLAGWLRGQELYESRSGGEVSAHRFPGGASTVLNLMRDGLRAEIRYGATLEAVEVEGEAVLLRFGDGTSATVDRVILTLPPPLLAKVALRVRPNAQTAFQDVPWPEAASATKMARAIKLALFFERPWWRDMGWSGSMQTDDWVQQTWDGSLGDRAVLNFYLCGDAAAHWSAHTDPVAGMLDALCAHFPMARDHFQGGDLIDWVADPYAQGAFSYLPPGVSPDVRATLMRPLGPIHFAGEHASTWTGFIEGALESAERIAVEIGPA